MDYEEYELLCEKERTKNRKYLNLFKKGLEDSGLTHKTIRQHVDNVDFYINEFLLREEPLSMADGCGSMISMFLGYFFIRKCMWSTPGTIKKTAASIKKFYKSMLIHDYIKTTDYKNLCLIIKEEMDEWQEDCRKYNEDIDDMSFEDEYEDEYEDSEEYAAGEDEQEFSPVNSGAIDFAAKKKWLSIAPELRKRIESNVFCAQCGCTTIQTGYRVESLPHGDIILKGKCKKCGAEVARMVEAEGFK
jgi:hypothetical protein